MIETEVEKHDHNTHHHNMNQACDLIETHVFEIYVITSSRRATRTTVGLTTPTSVG